jgi:hypothetical protein
MEAQSIVAAAASNAQASSSTSLGDRDIPIAIDEALLCATDLNPIDAQLYQSAQFFFLASTCAHFYSGKTSKAICMLSHGTVLKLSSQHCSLSQPNRLLMVHWVSSLYPRLSFQDRSLCPSSSRLQSGKSSLLGRVSSTRREMPKHGTRRSRNGFGAGARAERTENWRINGSLRYPRMQVRGLVTMKQCLLNSIFADVDFDAGLQARADRKARVEKNEKQRLANLPRSGSSKRTEDLERTLTTTRASTASMGK